MMKRTLILLLLAAPARAATYYISPNGSDSNNCTAAQDASTPKKTFVSFFACGTAGDTFVIMSTATLTTYAGTNTGYMSYDDGTCANCEQPPSGTSGNMTIVKSTDVTKTIRIDSGSAGAGRYSLFLGRSTRKDKFIKIEGLTFEGGGALYNTANIYVKNCGFHAARMDGGDVFGIGTSDGNWTNVNNLVEDVWIWGKDRLIASNYRASNNIWRRVFVRGDGCTTGACAGSGNPNVGFTVYNSSSVSVQNMMIVDRILGGAGSEYADFATAQHNAGGIDLGSQEYNTRNQWLGCMSLNSADTALNSECDGCTTPSIVLKDFAAIHPAGAGIDIGNNNVGVRVTQATVLRAPLSGGDGLRLAPEITGGTVFNIVVSSANRYGINSPATPSYVDVFNSGTSDFNNTSCSVGCLSSDPRGGASAAILYPTRIETGSALKGTGSGSADYGANMVYQYGLTGTFQADASSNTLTATALWPWPNEARIKSETCLGLATNWCGTGKTLTTYVWEFLGNTIPADIYGGGSATPTPPKIASRGSMTLKNVRLR